MASSKVAGFISRYKFILRLFLVNILYLRTLERCEESYKNCYEKLHWHFLWWGFYLFLAALIYINTLLICVRETVHAVKVVDWDGVNQSLGKVILMVLNYYALISLQPGFTFQAHGSLSRIFLVMLIWKILIYKLAIILIDFVTGSRKPLGVLLKSSIWIIILGYLVYRATFTRDNFFQGFANQKLQHGPNFQALKTVDNLTK